MSGPNSKRTDVSAILRLCRGIAKPEFRPAGVVVATLQEKAAPPPQTPHPLGISPLPGQPRSTLAKPSTWLI